MHTLIRFNLNQQSNKLEKKNNYLKIVVFIFHNLIKYCFLGFFLFFINFLQDVLKQVLHIACQLYT